MKSDNPLEPRNPGFDSQAAGVPSGPPPGVASSVSSEPARPYPSIGQAIGLLILLFFVFLGVSLVVDLLPRIFLQTSEEFHLLGISNLVGISLVAWIGWKKTSLPFRRVFPLLPVRPLLLLPLAGMVLGMAVLLSEMDNLIQLIFPMPASLRMIFEQMIGSKVALVGLVVVAPLTEEYLFRGLILQGFLRNYTVRKAVILSGLLFGIFHLIPWQIPSAVTAGLLLGWMMVRTGSLLPCLFAHALNNLIPHLLLASNIQIPNLTVYADTSRLQPLWLDVSGFFLFAVSLWGFLRMTGSPQIE